MERIRVLGNRFVSLFRGRELDARLDEELHAHIDLAIAERVRRGMTECEARTVALREFGGVTQTRENYRVQRGLPWLEQIARDLRYGWRTLYRTPGFTTTAILVMALGIGANVAIFSIVRTVLLNPLPYRDPQQLAAIYSHTSNATKVNQFSPVD